VYYNALYLHNNIDSNLQPQNKFKIKKRCILVGAGISGLIAAYELEQEGYRPNIIEQTDEVGGRVKAINKKGYALDIVFQVLLSAYPLANEYFDIDKRK